MTQLVQVTLDPDESVRVACLEDASDVLRIRRRRRHHTAPIWREFVVARDNAVLPNDLLTRTRLRSHLRVEPRPIVNLLRETVKEELAPMGLLCDPDRDMRLEHCSYLIHGISLDYLIYRITRIA